MSFESVCRQAFGDQQKVKAKSRSACGVPDQTHMKALARSEPFRSFLTVYSSYDPATLFG